MFSLLSQIYIIIKTRAIKTQFRNTCLPVEAPFQIWECKKSIFCVYAMILEYICIYFSIYNNKYTKQPTDSYVYCIHIRIILCLGSLNISPSENDIHHQKIIFFYVIIIVWCYKSIWILIKQKIYSFFRISFCSSSSCWPSNCISRFTKPI